MPYDFAPLSATFEQPWRLRMALHAWALAAPLCAESWLRERHDSLGACLVLAQIDAQALSQDPGGTLADALLAAPGLLTAYERRGARAWLEAHDPQTLDTLLLPLLQSTEGGWVEVAELLEGLPWQAGGAGPGRLSVGVLSLWMHLCQPERFAWVPSPHVFAPAWRFLAAPEGKLPASRAKTLLAGCMLYEALRKWWSHAGDFHGTLFDVHLHLDVLASQEAALSGVSWAQVPSFQDLLLLAETTTDAAQRSAWQAMCEELGQKMRQCCFDQNQPQDPYHGIELEDYARTPGSRATTLTRIAEYDARHLCRLHVETAEAFGLGMQHEGSWTVQGEEGVDREGAQTSFEMRVKPLLREISEVAQMMLGQRASTRLKYLVGRPYRSLDGQLLCLTLLAHDPTWTWHAFLPVNRALDLERWAGLIGLEPRVVRTFEDYLDVQAALRAALADAEAHAATQGTSASSFSWTLLSLWATHHELGQLLFSYLDPPSPVGLDPQSGPLVDPQAQDSPARRGVHPVSLDAWDELLASLVEPRLERLARVLRLRHNVVLYGPPGTGKTVLSTAFAQRWRQWQSALHGEEGASLVVEAVTFHPSYGYEEFIEGFRPHHQPGQFVLKQGILTELALRAAGHPERQYLLLIDEFNRGDVARIFGELITLIEPDKRSPEHARRRMISGEPLWLPPNVFILGTMNTADKSISLLDIAIRRRFAFEHMPPEPGLLARTPGLLHDVQGVYLHALLGALNARLARAGIDPERWLGHSFLWIEQSRVDDPVEALAHRFRLDIIPLIEEYCFADRRQMKAILGPLVDVHGQPDERVIGGGERFLAALRGLIEPGAGGG